MDNQILQALVEIRDLLRELVTLQRGAAEDARDAAVKAAATLSWTVDGVLEARRRNGER